MKDKDIKIIKAIDDREIHNMHAEQATDWHSVAKDKNLTNNQIRIWILMNLLHDGWIGINKAFEICEEFGIFESRFAVQHALSVFRNPELFDEDGNRLLPKKDIE